MKQPDNTVYLRHMLDSIAKVKRYLSGVDLEKFGQDSLIQDGVIRQIQIIGEVARRVSPDFRDRYPVVPWHDIVRMRSVLVHNYFGVHLPTVYSTAVNDLPPREVSLWAVLRDLESESG
jgi:uncharacterized protein with HEPN domain